MQTGLGVIRHLKTKRFVHVGHVYGADLFVHWSVLLIAGLMLVNSVRQPLLTLVGGLSYLSVLLIHECGHVIAARRKRCAVQSVSLYPIHGRTVFDTPWSRFDHCVIAWGGVIAQAAVGVPLAIWVAVFGYTRFEPLNAVLAILGFFNLAVAAFNLIPKPPLDGAIAWVIVPLLIKRLRDRKKQKTYRHPFSKF